MRGRGAVEQAGPRQNLHKSVQDPEIAGDRPIRHPGVLLAKAGGILTLDPEPDDERGQHERVQLQGERDFGAVREEGGRVGSGVRRLRHQEAPGVPGTVHLPGDQQPDGPAQHLQDAHIRPAQVPGLRQRHALQYPNYSRDQAELAHLPLPRLHKRYPAHRPEAGHPDRRLSL